jgi:hypothetical protein
MAFWYNLSTGQVETDEDKSQSDDLMGPYDTEAGARNALELARQRTERWDEEDREWEEGRSED